MKQVEDFETPFRVIPMYQYDSLGELRQEALDEGLRATSRSFVRSAVGACYGLSLISP